MGFRCNVYAARIITLATISAVVLLYDGAHAAQECTRADLQPEIASLNAVLESARAQSSPGFYALIDRVHAQGRLPVIVRLRAEALPRDIFADGTEPGPQTIDGLQRMVLDDMFAQTARDETELHTKRFNMIPAMALQVDAAGLEALLANPNVIDIIEDIPVPPALQDSVPLIGGWPDGSFADYTGAGQTVAILDTGVDKHHPFLNGNVVSEACYSSNVPTSGATSLCPGGTTSSTSVNSGLPCNLSIYGCDHGTHIAGIVSGSSNTFSGIAKDASIIAIQVFSRFSSGCGNAPSPCAMAYTSDQIKGLERVYTLRKKHAIASANMSLGGGMFTSPCNSDPRKPIIDSLRAANIATVISSGNNGYTNALATPGCIGSAVSVGSTTKMDTISSSSNSADFLSLLAPGGSILSSVPGTIYAIKNGTSMSAPHVAGAWAVFRQAQPNASVTDVLGALQFNGVPVEDTRTDAGSRVKSRIEVQNALDSLLAPGSWIGWDDGVQINAIGLTNGGTLSVASRWQPEEIRGTEITKIRVGVRDVPDSAAVQIWQGTDAATMELQYSQAFSPAAQQINEIVLDAPYVIDRSKELFFGWSATHRAGEYPCAIDAATNKNQPKNWLLLDDTWQHSDVDGDWIAQACLEGCRLNISHTKLISDKLGKDKKCTLKITGDENFDPSGQIDPGPLHVLDTKITIKKNKLKIKALAPAGLEQGTIVIRVGECFGEIKIL